jgi:hypothetical protein
MFGAPVYREAFGRRKECFALHKARKKHSLEPPLLAISWFVRSV